jgi:hypothetical protein
MFRTKAAAQHYAARMGWIKNDTIWTRPATRVWMVDHWITTRAYGFHLMVHADGFYFFD